MINLIHEDGYEKAREYLGSKIEESYRNLVETNEAQQ